MEAWDASNWVYRSPTLTDELAAGGSRPDRAQSMSNRFVFLGKLVKTESLFKRSENFGTSFEATAASCSELN